MSDVERRYSAPWLAATAIAVALICACLGPGDPATFEASYSGTANYPIGMVRLAGGPNGEVAVIGAPGPPATPTKFLPPIIVRPAAQWPVTVALAAGADTLAATTVVLRLDAGHAVQLSLIAGPNLAGWFICAPIVARTPIRGSGPSPDTLYVLSLSLPSGVAPPVC